MSDFDFWTADLIKTYFAMLVSRKKKYKLVNLFVYNLDVFSSFNLYNAKSTYIKIIPQLRSAKLNLNFYFNLEKRAF